jgi:hypothetical protein
LHAGEEGGWLPHRTVFCCERNLLTIDQSSEILWAVKSEDIS